MDFNAGAFIGCLGWLANTTRLDIPPPTNGLSRVTGKKDTAGLRAACKKVLRYLLASSLEGVRYSPKQEQQFKTFYGALLSGQKEGHRHRQRESPAIHTLGGVSFASDYITRRSVSGCILYMHSAPIVWTSRRQSLRAYSTQAAEWIAASDAITIEENSATWLKFFCKKYTTPGISWCHSKVAIQGAAGPAGRPASRHPALR